MRETLLMVAERGLGGTAVIDIEAAAGLSPGSGAFYRHFHSKEEALGAAVQHEIDRLAAAQPEPHDNGCDHFAAESDGPDQATVAGELLAGLSWLQELGPLLSVVLREGRRYPEAAAGVRQAIRHGGLTAGLQSAGRASLAAGRDPWATAVVVTLAAVGYHLASEYFEGPVEGIDAERFAAALADLVTAPAP